MSSLFCGIIACIILMFFIFCFVIRPQKKQEIRRKYMIDNLKRGDQVVMFSGLHGEAYEIDRKNQTIILDCDDIYLEFNLRSIATVKHPKQKREGDE